MTIIKLSDAENLKNWEALLTPTQLEAYKLAKKQGYLVSYASKDKKKYLYNTFYHWCKASNNPFIVITPRPRSKSWAHVKCDLFPVIWANKFSFPVSAKSCDERFAEKSEALLREKYREDMEPDSHYGFGAEFSYANLRKGKAIALAKDFRGAFDEIVELQK
jgi:hypothetical protein